MKRRNVMNWNCETDGCFNVKRRPKIEEFGDCFPRNINFGDVDGIVELNGCFCMLEWKGAGGSIKTGQRISYEQFTRYPSNAVFIAEGDAETMAVTRFCKFKLGKQDAWQVGGLPELKRAIRGWVTFAEARSQAA